MLMWSPVAAPEGGPIVGLIPVGLPPMGLYLPATSPRGAGAVGPLAGALQLGAAGALPGAAGWGGSVGILAAGVGLPLPLADPGRHRGGVAYAPLGPADRAVLAVAGERGLSLRTQRTYMSHVNGFLAFFKREGVDPPPAPSYGSMSAFLAWYVLLAPNKSKLVPRGHNPGTTVQVRCALKSYWQLRLGLPWPLVAVDEYRLDVLVNSLAEQRVSACLVRAAVRRVQLLRAFEAALRVEGDSFELRSMRANVAVAHHAMLRVSEYTDRALVWNDVKFRLVDCVPKEASILLRDPKTGDKLDAVTGGTQTVLLGVAPPGWPDALGLLYALALESDYLSEEARGRPVFLRAGSRTLSQTPAAFNETLRCWLALDPEHDPLLLPFQSSHSLRKGGATDWFEEGVSEPTLKLMGRWASDAWLLYVRLDLSVLEAAAEEMAAREALQAHGAGPPGRLEAGRFARAARGPAPGVKKGGAVRPGRAAWAVRRKPQKARGGVLV